MNKLHRISQPICQFLLILCFLGLCLLWLAIQWLSTLPFYVQVVFGAVTAFISMASYSNIQAQRFHQRRFSIVSLAQLSSAGIASLRRLLPDHEKALSWLPDPSDAEPARWINLALEKAWPYIKEVCSGRIEVELAKVLNKFKSGIIEDVSVGKINLGNVCPYVQGIKYRYDGEDKVSLELEVDWRKNQEQEMVLHLLISGLEYTVQVKHFIIYSEMKITFTPFKEKLPCFGALVLSIMESPLVDFKMKIIEGDGQSMPDLKKAVARILLAALEGTLVWPKRVVVPFIPDDYSDLKSSCVGHLDVTLVEAKELANNDILGKSDPYAVLSVGWGHDLMKESSVINDTSEPMWNEQFLFDVEDYTFQKLTVKLMNKDNAGRHLCVGTAELPINQLEENSRRSIWVDLIGDPTKLGNRTAGKVHLIVEFKPSKNSCGVNYHERTLNASIMSTTNNDSLRGLATILGGSSRKGLKSVLEDNENVPPSASSAVMLNSDTKGLSFVLENTRETKQDEALKPTHGMLNTGISSQYDQHVNGLSCVLESSQETSQNHVPNTTYDMSNTSTASSPDQKLKGLSCLLETAQKQVSESMHGKIDMVNDSRSWGPLQKNRDLKLKDPSSYSTDSKIQTHLVHNKGATRDFQMSSTIEEGTIKVGNDKLYADVIEHNKDEATTGGHDNWAIDQSRSREHGNILNLENPMIHEQMFESEIFQVD